MLKKCQLAAATLVDRFRNDLTIFERENFGNAACLEVAAVKIQLWGARSLKLWWLVDKNEFLLVM